MSSKNQLRMLQGALCVFLAGLFVSLARGDFCDTYCNNVWRGYSCTVGICKGYEFPDCVPCTTACVYVGDYGACGATTIDQRVAPCDCPEACDCTSGRTIIEGQLTMTTGNWVPLNLKVYQCH